MKLLSSFKKELILATRSFYFYIEVFFALVLLAVLLFAIPEHSQRVETQYIYLDMPDQAVQYFIGDLEKELDGRAETTEIAVGDEKYPARLIGAGEEKYYFLDSEEAVRAMADKNRNIGAVISLKDDGQLYYRYYLQGYESPRLKNLISVMFNQGADVLEERFNAQEVRLLAPDYVPLNEKENAIPPLLAFNSALMGMFIMAAYVFLDKKEGVIRAYAVTASSVSRYLLSKTFVILATAVFSGLVVAMPIMGFNINYGLLLLLLLTSGFCASVAGLLIASFYKDIEKAFGAIFFLMIVLMLPSIAYFIPGWDPVWIRFLPSYPLIEGFKEILVKNGDAVYTLLVSAGFLAAGVLLFALTNVRFKRTLSV